MEWDLKSSVLDPDRSKIQDHQHLDPYRSKVQDHQILDPYRSKIIQDDHHLDPYRSKIQDDHHLDPYRSKIIQDDQHLDQSMWDLKSSVLDPDRSKIQDHQHLDPTMFIQCYSVPTGRVSTLMIRPPSSNSSSLDIDTEVAEINNNISRR